MYYAAVSDTHSAKLKERQYRRLSMNEYFEMILIASPLLILGVVVAGTSYWLYRDQQQQRER